MKTRCPVCETLFRISPEQLKARAGKVRCGQCQTVFNALDFLIDESEKLAARPSSVSPPPPSANVPLPLAAAAATPPAKPLPAETPPPIAPSEPPPAVERIEPVIVSPAHIDMPQVVVEPPQPVAEPAFLEPAIHNDESLVTAEDAAPPDGEVGIDHQEPSLSAAALHELGKSSGLIAARDTTEIPGYSKWSEGVMSPVAVPEEKPARWPFVLVALILVTLLVGQVAYRYRSELAITTPMLRPALTWLSLTLGVDLPLPRHVDLVSIETSDLQSDPARGNLLILNATLRNRARYEQALPSLELSLTDTGDNAVARRVFAPADYLGEKALAHGGLPANADLPVRVWIEAREITAAGYRLYVFYP